MGRDSIYTRTGTNTDDDWKEVNGIDIDGVRALCVTEADPSLSLFGEKVTGVRTSEVSVNFNYNLPSDMVVTADSGTGASTADQHTLKLSSGTGVGTAQTNSVSVVFYRPGSEGFCIFSAAFESGGEAGVTQKMGLGTATNQMMLGYNGTDFSVQRMKDSTETWTAQAAFNGEDISWLDPTKLNVYSIRYGWLGISPITYWVYSGAKRNWVLIHSTDLTNTQTLPHTGIPVLPVCGTVVRASGTGSDIIVRAGSWRGGIIDGGGRRDFHRHFTVDNTKTLGSAVNTNIITVRSKASYQSAINTIASEFENFSADSDGTKRVTLTFVRNATIGGTPSWTDVNTENSVNEFDIAGTTVSGGRLLFTSYLGKVDRTTFNLLPFDYTWAPGDSITIAALSANASDVSVALNWGEIF